MRGAIKGVLWEELQNSIKMKKAYEKQLRQLPLPSPSKITRKVDVPTLLKDLGFVSTISGSRGLLCPFAPSENENILS